MVGFEPGVCAMVRVRERTLPLWVRVWVIDRENVPWSFAIARAWPLVPLGLTWAPVLTWPPVEAAVPPVPIAELPSLVAPTPTVEAEVPPAEAVPAVPPGGVVPGWALGAGGGARVAGVPPVALVPVWPLEPVVVALVPVPVVVPPLPVVVPVWAKAAPASSAAASVPVSLWMFISSLLQWVQRRRVAWCRAWCA